MAKRKSKDPRKPSKAYLEQIGETAKPKERDNAPEPSPAPTTQGKGKQPKKENDVLRRAIQELGGDDEDYDLLNGVDSDDEEPQAPAAKKDDVIDKKLKSELASFIKGLDLSSVAPDADEEEEDDEEEEEEEEEEEDDVEQESVAEEIESAEQSGESEASDEDDDASATDDDDDSEEDASSQASSVSAPGEENDGLVIKSGLQNTAEARIDNIPLEPVWYTIPVPTLPQPAQPLEPLPPFRFAGVHSRANSMLNDFRERQAAASGAGGARGGTDAAFVAQILRDGTHQDKLSALILLVRESPLHRMAELDRLKAMAGGSAGGGLGGREEKVATLRALADWWVSGGGKQAGKLRYLADQPMLGHPGVTDRHMLLWAFEDWLKKWFFSILQILEVFLHDTLPFVRTQCLAVTFKLLAGNAEQEQNLLRLGVNKLGDNEKSVASKASHHLLVLLQNHPAMKAVVVREVSALVLKPVASKTVHPVAAKGKNAASAPEAGLDHARYYGLVTLNQIMLTSRDRDVAAKLVDVYFDVFRELLQATPDADKGAAEDDPEASAKARTERIAGKIHNFQGRKKGTRLSKRRGQQREGEEVEQGDAKLIAAVLTGVTRALPFARLDESVFSAHAETLFRVTHTATFNISLRALMLIYQIAEAKESIMDRYYRVLYDSLLDPRLITSSKQAMYLNLLFKSIRADRNLGRVMAFVKRLLQVMMGHQPPFICGALYLLGELFSTTSGLRALLTEGEDNGVEHFRDADGKKDASEALPTAASSFGYDGRKRDPAYAGAQGSCLWELVPFVHHYHPSVSLQATQLLDLNLPLSGSEDITQNTLVAFLDRFVYRNPKKVVTAKGASIMQPAAVSRSGGTSIIKSKSAAGATEAGYVNSEAFWHKKPEDVPADQLFFHKFFAAKLAKDAAIKKAKKKPVKDQDEDEDIGEDEEAAPGGADEVESDPEEAEIWRVMQSTMPDADDMADLLSDEEDADLDFSESEDEDAVAPAKDEGGEESEESASIQSDDNDEDELDDEEAGAFSDDSDDGLQGMLGEESDDDLVSLNDMPTIELDGGLSDDGDAVGKKRKREADEKKERRKKRKALPLLASAEDYAALIDGAEEENL